MARHLRRRVTPHVLASNIVEWIAQPSALLNACISLRQKSGSGSAKLNMGSSCTGAPTRPSDAANRCSSASISTNTLQTGRLRLES